MDYVLLQLAKLQLRVADLEAREASFRRCFQLRRGREADRCLRAVALQTQATASSNSKVSEEVKAGVVIFALNILFFLWKSDPKNIHVVGRLFFFNDL